MSVAPELPATELVPRVEGGWWVVVPSRSTVIGWVGTSTDPDVNWIACPSWTGGLDPLIDQRARDRAVRALVALWLADPDTNAPEVPAP